MSVLTNILEKSELFVGLGEEDYNALSEVFVHCLYKTDERILSKGDPGDSLYIIADGTVTIHDGDFILANLGPGTFFGEMAFFENSTRTVSVTAETEVVLYFMSREQFNDVFKTRPHILQKMVAAITRRIGMQNQRIISDLTSRNEELDKLVEIRTAELRSTQDQLVQQEKLASLGQLTAGIAHEIKNPLNFVTNFAKLSMELVDEVIESDNPDERKEAGDYLRKNIQKIFEHGSRADSIVKGMLEHTRATSGGGKSPENANMICEQFLKISLEAFKMNNVEFDIAIKVELDHNIPKISLAPLDISKVFLNIFMNAFYSMNERKKTDPEHKPVLEVRSEIIGQSVQFSITDNGIGLPADVIGRVFNPFFTTKPTGKGTGLGLSISNDIIKAHGGTIKCQNISTGGAVFHIELPLDK